MSQSMRVFACALAFAVMAPAARAATIPIVSVTPSDTFFSYDVNDLINGSGLSAGLHDNNFENMWMSDYHDTPEGSLVFDLGDAYALNFTSIWNYNADCCGLERGVRTFDVYGSLDSVSFSLIGSYLLGMSPGGSIPAQTFGLSGTWQYVMFDLLTNYGADNYIGLSEVQFDGDVAEQVVVPEPASLGLVGAGALLLAARARARRSRR